MLRIIVRIDDAGMAANVGGPVLSTYRTIDVDLPELEELLRTHSPAAMSYVHAQVVGVEVIADRTTRDTSAARQGE